jgi:hypothetical protein
MSTSLRVLIALACTAGVAAAQPAPTPEPAPPAEAEPEPDLDSLIERATGPSAQKIALGTVRRARRAVSLGPTVGGWGAVIPSPGETEAAVTFGLGLEVFKIPIVPSATNIKALVQERVKARLRQHITDRLKGVPPEPGELERIAQEVFEEVKGEVLGELNARPKTMERPRFSVGLEGNRLLDSEAWLTRLRAGIGIWKVTLAGSLAVGFTDDKTVFTGLELATHFLISKNPRASVVDVFVRADFEVTDRDVNTDHISLGVRFLLDVI